jgi:hypothetical protein
MKQHNQWDLLHLFGEEIEGEATSASANTPQITETGAMEASAPAAGETTARETREEDFRALMEGEYKDLFTAYFQETFNRRFRERKEEIEELERARKTLHAAAEYFGVGEGELSDAIRAENEKRRALTEAPKAPPPTPREDPLEEMRRRVEGAVEEAREQTERAVLAAIRARGLRPTEAALAAESSRVLTVGVSSLSRAQRAEVARRAAKGERIKF